MELRLPLEVFPGRQATCRAVFGTWGSFPDDARASHCPFVLTSFTGWSSKRCPSIGFLSRGDREIGVLRNVEAPTRPRLECRREPGLILRCDRKVGNLFQTKQGSRPSCRDQEGRRGSRSEEHTSELQSPLNLVCRLLLEKKKKTKRRNNGEQKAEKEKKRTGTAPQR